MRRFEIALEGISLAQGKKKIQFHHLSATRSENRISALALRVSRRRERSTTLYTFFSQPSATRSEKPSFKRASSLALPIAAAEAHRTLARSLFPCCRHPFRKTHSKRASSLALPMLAARSERGAHSTRGHGFRKHSASGSLH